MAIPIATAGQEVGCWNLCSNCTCTVGRRKDPCPTSIFRRMILSETLRASNTSIHSSATITPTPAVPLLFPDQNSLYLVSLPLITLQWLPWYQVSCRQQRSTLLLDSVSTTSHTLPFRVFTVSVPTLSIRCLRDLPKRPDFPPPLPPPPPEWGPSQTPLAASPNVDFEDTAIVNCDSCFCGIACSS